MPGAESGGYSGKTLAAGWALSHRNWIKTQYMARVPMPRMLSPHFTLDEFTFSQTAARLGLDNTPDARTLKNLRHLAATLEQVRGALGDCPIIISSGYRSPALNRAVGGSVHSAHMLGLAVDFTCPQYGSVLATARAAARSAVGFDQMILEYGRWVHLGIAEDAEVARGELLSIGSSQTYVAGLRVV